MAEQQKSEKQENSIMKDQNGNNMSIIKSFAYSEKNSQIAADTNRRRRSISLGKSKYLGDDFDKSEQINLIQHTLPQP